MWNETYVKKKLEVMYRETEKAAEELGTKWLSDILGDYGARDAINATFFGAVMREMREDKIFKEDMTRTILLAATMLKS